MNRRALAILVLSLLAACAPKAPADTGIQGRVTVGPMCPVVRPGQDCPDQPYQTVLTVLTESGSVVMRFRTDEDGRFRALLAPGAYVMHPETPEGAFLPHAPEQTFTVTEGQFTEINVVYDSGIR
jgi:hypothetical protein